MTKPVRALCFLSAAFLTALSPVACGLPASSAQSGSTATEQADRGTTAGADQGEASMQDSEAWKRITSLIRDQKMQEALDQVAPLLAAARERGDHDAWTRALVTGTQLRTALSGFETAVRFLRDEAWPDDPASRLVLELFYAHALVRYRQAYAYDIGQREQVVATDEVDVAAWTGAQIAAEIHAAFGRAWRLRQAWGDASLGRLAAYVEQNGYPARIRGTLRDTVSYLWAEALADQSGWTPAESNGVHRLDLEDLLAGRLPGDAPVDDPLGDPRIHPLAKMAAVLGDLERWHRSGDRPEAAFEAFRQRIEHLRPHTDSTSDAARAREALEARLDQLGRRYPWWSMGQATLADMLRSSSGPTRLIEAHRAAMAGAEAFPQSVGGRRCQHIVDSIEAPTFQLAGMAVDGPGHRSLGVQHQNLERLHFRAYRIALDAVLGSRSGPFRPVDPRTAASLITGREPDAAWAVDLPRPGDFASHRTDIEPPIEGPGFVLIMASARQDFRPTDNQLQGVLLQISDLVTVSERLADDRLAVTVRRGDDGTLVAGARAEIHAWRRDQDPSIVSEGTTDADGRVMLAVPARTSWTLLVRHDDDVLLDLQAQRAGWFGRTRRAEPHTLIYTDRAIYRPGQEVLWKTVTYEPAPDSANGRRFRTKAGETITVALRDANHEQIAELEVTTNAFGSASGRFTLPAGRLLGSWSLQATWNGHTQVLVEAYKRPTFEVAIDDPERALRLGEPAVIEGTASFHFGLPVTDGEVAWRVVREPDVRPFHGFARWWPQPGPPEVIAAGRSPLEADGSFTLTFTPRGDARLADADPSAVRYRYRVAADVTAGGGETRSAERSFAVGAIAVTALVEAPPGFFDAGGTAEIAVVRSDLDGTPRAGAGRWRLVRVAQPDRTLLPAEQPLPPPPDDLAPFLTAGDRQRPRWQPGYDPERLIDAWPDGAVLARGTVEHGEDGRATIALERLPAGLLRLIYETDDAFGTPFTTRHELLVVDAAEATTDAEIALPALLALEQTSYRPGEVARILVASGHDQVRMTFEAWRGTTRIFARELAGGGGATRIDLPIESDDRGGLTVRLRALGDYQLMELEERLAVPYSDRRLDVAFETFRDRLRPGDQETWRIVLRGEEGVLGPGAAEILASMYDQSLDLFAPHQPPSIASAFPMWPTPPRPSSALGAAQLVHAGGRGFVRPAAPSPPAVDRLRFFDETPIGGPGRSGVPGRPMTTMTLERGKTAPGILSDTAESSAESFTADAARAAPRSPPAPPAATASDPVRENFAETAFWRPHLLLDDAGGVSFSFTVPDAVTAWTVWVEALTRDLASGSARHTVRTARDLLVRPQMPRFLRAGDRARIVVSIDNTSDAPLDGTLALDILDPASDASRATDFGLPAGGLRDLAFRVEPGRTIGLDVLLQAPRDLGAAALRVVGRAGDAADGELRPLPVLPSRIHLVTSRFAAVPPDAERRLTFGDLADDDPARSDEQLVVQVDGQLLLSVLEAVPYLVDYPYPSVEASIERYVAAGTVASLLGRLPALAEVATRMAAERHTRLETFDDDDPNRRALLIETPWLVTARGGGDTEWGLLRILDPEVAATTRDRALDELVRAQRGDGAFPWFPGGPPSPTITLQVLYGFSKALELGVDHVPEDVIQRAWAYLARHWRQEIWPRAANDTCCGETAAFFAYVLSSYDDAERFTGGVLTEDDRRRILDLGMRHWRTTAPLPKVYLATALTRAGRHQDAALVLDSVLDSARTDPDLGVYWQPEARAWLFYNDTITTHATVLRALDELRPDDPRTDGLLQWLLVNKSLNHWQSARATAEVLYTIVRRLERGAPLTATDAALVTLGDRRKRFTFTPASYLERDNQLVLEGPEIDPDAMRSIDVANQGARMIFARATWHVATDQPPAEGDGDLFGIERTTFRRRIGADGARLEALEAGDTVAVGDQIEVQLEITSRAPAEYVHVRDPRPAGLEPEIERSGYRFDRGIAWYEQVGDSGADLFFERLPAGTATVRYRLRANVAGHFQAAPAVIQSVYAPSFAGYSAGGTLVIGPQAE